MVVGAPFLWTACAVLGLALTFGNTDKRNSRSSSIHWLGTLNACKTGRKGIIVAEPTLRAEPATQALQPTGTSLKSST